MSRAAAAARPPHQATPASPGWSAVATAQNSRQVVKSQTLTWTFKGPAIRRGKPDGPLWPFWGRVTPTRPQEAFLPGLSCGIGPQPSTPLCEHQQIPPVPAGARAATLRGVSPASTPCPASRTIIWLFQPQPRGTTHPFLPQERK
uniref:Uncharacterized protein n=1 Tax=Piliocolobus tephrosceles TaxID=591936 RepID=A0A8C9LPX8_9PRIM